MPAPAERPPVSFIDAHRLHAHEQFVEARVAELQAKMAKQGAVPVAIVADAKSLVILDGHHRYEALKRLGCRRVPVMLVDYHRADIRVSTWREGESPPEKDEVIAQALVGKLFPPKSTRHFFPWKFAEHPVPLAHLR